MKTKISKYLHILIVLVFIPLLVSCATPKPASLSNDQVGQVTSAVLKSIDEGNFQNFTQNFSAPMKEAFTESKFTEMQALLNKAAGKYSSCGQPSLSNSQGYVAYRFICKYELEDVVVTVTFQIAGDKVEGLFFDSVNLRKLSK
jgi:hypothetical protein